MFEKTLSILRAQRTASRYLLCWRVVEGLDSVTVLDTSGIQRLDQSGEPDGRYLLIRVPRVLEDLTGLRVRYENEFYHIREVRYGVRISEVELLCETMDDYLRAEARKATHQSNLVASISLDRSCDVSDRDSALLSAVAAAVT